jgi:hypothetical protein
LREDGLKLRESLRWFVMPAVAKEQDADGVATTLGGESRLENGEEGGNPRSVTK